MLGKIAIVGANGFVGKQVLQQAVARGTEVVGVVRSEAAVESVRSSGGSPSRLADLSEAETTALVPRLQGCDGLVYTASVSVGSKAQDRTDPAGLQNVMRACAEASVPRFVFFSGLGVARYGMARHCTNPYFLAKLAGEVALYRSSLAVTVFRPSYIFGHGDEFLTPLIERLMTEPGESVSGTMEIPGDGAYRLQPVSVSDAARATLGALDGVAPGPRVVDLVGPEIVSYRALLGRIAVVLGQSLALRERPIEEAIATARASGYFGLRSHDLDCLLCDEVSNPAPTAALITGDLESLNAMIVETVATVRQGRERP